MKQSKTTFNSYAESGSVKHGYVKPCWSKAQLASPVKKIDPVTGKVIETITHR